MLGTAGEGGEAWSVVRVCGRGGARCHPGRGLPACGRRAGRRGAAQKNPKDGVVGWLGVDKARGEREGGRSSISSMVRVVDGGRRRIEI